jgi:hypothetical protein
MERNLLGTGLSGVKGAAKVSTDALETSRGGRSRIRIKLLGGLLADATAWQ